MSSTITLVDDEEPPPPRFQSNDYVIEEGSPRCFKSGSFVMSLSLATLESQSGELDAWSLDPQIAKAKFGLDNQIQSDLRKSTIEEAARMASLKKKGRPGMSKEVSGILPGGDRRAYLNRQESNARNFQPKVLQTLSASKDPEPTTPIQVKKSKPVKHRKSWFRNPFRTKKTMINKDEEQWNPYYKIPFVKRVVNFIYK